ncbi:MAG: hypothetical protein K2X82_04090 [Gemmataceae bacterium]|nr:hypothetical protein [Gemmataceae bacterium]
MRGRLVLAGVGLLLSATAGFAQPGQPPALLPRFPAPPAVPPPAQTAPPPGATVPAPAQLPPGVPVDVPLPYPENKAPIDVGALTVRRANGAWQVVAAGRVFRETGGDESAARDVVRVLRDLRPTEWAVVGSPRPVVEYGLRDGRAVPVAAFPRQVVPLDLPTARVEQVRGVWVVRDAANIVFNCGPNKADADQALAVARKYGFNRVGTVGPAAAPALTYFFPGPTGDDQPRPGANPLAVAAQEQALARTGVPLPGVGYVGQQVKIDPRKVEARRDGAEWVVAHGPDVLARFGAGEWNARDAARAVQDGRFTEFCTVGPATFFLVNGRAPTRVGMAYLKGEFDPNALAVRDLGGRWAVVAPDRGGREKPVWDVSGPAEGETLIRLARHYRFDQVCRAGGDGLTFLARSR